MPLPSFSKSNPFLSKSSHLRTSQFFQLLGPKILHIPLSYTYNAIDRWILTALHCVIKRSRVHQQPCSPNTFVQAADWSPCFQSCHIIFCLQCPSVATGVILFKFKSDYCISSYTLQSLQSSLKITSRVQPVLDLWPLQSSLSHFFLRLLALQS